MKIVAIDFETANSTLTSPCSLGFCIYDEGVILDNFEWYIKPPEEYAYFTNTFIHHITYKDVADAQSLDQYFAKLEEIFSDSLIIAHNARFDLGVLNATLDYYGLKHFLNPYLDTVTFARRFYPYLSNHKLDTLSNYLGLRFNHHNAKSDAYCCMMIILKAMETSGIFDIKELLKILHLKINYNR